MAFIEELIDAEEMILTYVPEAEWIDFDQAFQLAMERDMEAANELLMGIKMEEVYYGE